METTMQSGIPAGRPPGRPKKTETVILNKPPEQEKSGNIVSEKQDVTGKTPDLTGVKITNQPVDIVDGHEIYTYELMSSDSPLKQVHIPGKRTHYTRHKYKGDSHRVANAMRRGYKPVEVQLDDAIPNVGEPSQMGSIGTEHCGNGELHTLMAIPNKVDHYFKQKKLENRRRERAVERKNQFESGLVRPEGEIGFLDKDYEDFKNAI